MVKNTIFFRCFYLHIISVFDFVDERKIRLLNVVFHFCVDIYKFVELTVKLGLNNFVQKSIFETIELNDECQIYKLAV